MNSRDRLRHPGPEIAPRLSIVRGTVREGRMTLPPGAVLMEAVAAGMDRLAADCAVLILDGVTVGPFDYVMPGPSPDSRHAAWYSATHRCDAARLTHATAIVGRRDGAWFLHCHAHWTDAAGRRAMGHLLPDRVRLRGASGVRALAFVGGLFEVAEDPETRFPIFRAVTAGSASGPPQDRAATIATIRPHEDLHGAVSAMRAELGAGGVQILGLGSLIGARFTDATGMESPISEALVLPGATDTALPVMTVDTAGGLFRGTLAPGGAPVCVTFEAMAIAQDQAGPTDQAGVATETAAGAASGTPSRQTDSSRIPSSR